MTSPIRVTIPRSYEAERRYVVGVLLGKLLGLAHEIVVADTDHTDIGGRVTVGDGLFAIASDDWLSKRAMPLDTPVLCRGVPVLYQTIGAAPVEVGETIRFGADLLGSAFFLLTRYEEVVSSRRDRHGRFAATESYAAKRGLLDRPLVNEYAELLWWALDARMSDLARPARTYRLLLGHDVDRPWLVAGRSPLSVVVSTASDLIRRRDVRLALRRAASFSRVVRGNWRADLFYTFDEIMERSERAGLRSAFYFRTAKSSDRETLDYSIGDESIRALLRDIHRRGHEIGLHPSYGSMSSPQQISDEFSALRTVCVEEGIEQERWGARQHYLRWENPTTWRAYEAAGIDYDCSLGFADRVGFRSGICCEYPAFDLENGRQLDLLERPLIAMEGTIKSYMGKSWDEVPEIVGNLADICRRFQGDMTLLWHNSSLLTADERRAYDGSLARCLP